MNKLNFELIEMPDDKYFIKLEENIMSYYDLVYNLVYIKKIKNNDKSCLEIKFTNSYNKTNETLYLYETTIDGLVGFLKSLKNQIIINPVDNLNFEDTPFEQKTDELPLMPEDGDIESPAEGGFYCRLNDN